MPNGHPTSFEFSDNGTDYGFEVMDPGTIRVRVASGDVGAAFDMSIVGAQRFSVMLSAVITRAINNH